jgi:hypothetical protein
MGCEQLESRQLLASDVLQWHNIYNPEDTNDDGYLNPMDALRVINSIHTYGQGRISAILASGEGDSRPKLLIDVNNDGSLSTNDVLRVFNKLNQEGEGNDTMSYSPTAIRVKVCLPLIST